MKKEILESSKVEAEKEKYQKPVVKAFSEEEIFGDYEILGASGVGGLGGAPGA